MELKNVLFERDLLFGIDKLEFGSVHAYVFGPNSELKVPLVLLAKSNHSVSKHLNAIKKVVQEEIFNRVSIDIDKSVDIHIRPDEYEKSMYGDSEYLKAVQIDGEIKFQNVSEIEV